MSRKSSEQTYAIQGNPQSLPEVKRNFINITLMHNVVTYQKLGSPQQHSRGSNMAQHPQNQFPGSVGNLKQTLSFRQVSCP